jgi:hypothetical protein
MCTETLTLTFSVVKNAPTFVEVRDEHGHSRAFEKGRQPLELSADEKTVTVVVAKKLWERRMKRLPEKAPVNERKASKPVAKKTRKCLICKHDFPQEKNQYICQPCKSTANWKSGGDYSFA